MTKQIEVIGRNGYTYNATPLRGDLAIVGTWIVRIQDGKVKDTVARATRANKKAIRAR